MGKYCAWQNAREIVIASSENCCAITLISNVWKMLFSYYADNVLKWGFTEQLIASCDSLCVPSELKVKRWFHLTIFTAFKERLRYLKNKVNKFINI